MSWVHTVLGEAQRQGLSAEALLAHAGIAQADRALERWPIDHITRLWRAASRLTDDPGFGLKAGCHIGPGSFNVVGFILQSAATLRQALGVMQKYQGLVSDGGRLQLLAGPQDSWLVYHPQQGELAFSPHQIEAVLAAIVTATRWVHPRPTPPRLVCFGHEAVGPLAGYREVFDCPVAFQHAFSGLLIDNGVLDEPLPQANAQMARLHMLHADAQLQALQAAQPTLPAQLRDWLRTHLGPPLPSRAEAARSVGLGERTLARRLQAEGTDFGTLLDQARREQALQWVRDTRRPLTDIARDLGFAELSPFYRAFARWTGDTPARWRARGAPPAATPLS
jgi:AraC-like DNA-binding protein